MSATKSAAPACPLPQGFIWGDEWEDDHDAPGGFYRVVSGPEKTTTDSKMTCQVWATQLCDGTIDDGTALGECPHIFAAGHILNTDQAREVAATLLELAAQIDRWVR